MRYEKNSNFLVVIFLAAIVSFSAKADVRLELSEALFVDISNLTCKDLDGSKLDTPVSIDTPGKHLIISGYILNDTQEYQDVAIGTGTIKPLEPDSNGLQVPLAGLFQPVEGMRYFLEPNSAVPLNVKFPTGSINSQGYYRVQMEKTFGFGAELNPLRIGRNAVELSFATFVDGERQYSEHNQTIDFYADPNRWIVDGEPFLDGFCPE